MNTNTNTNTAAAHTEASLLTPYQRDCVEAASARLEAVMNGTLTPGDGQTVSPRQVALNISNAINSLAMALASIKLDEGND